MAEVNDLSASDIIAYRMSAMKLLTRKASKNRFELYCKRSAYAVELFRNDRPKLWGHLKNTVKGIK